jgi:hypothetical protein
VSKRIPGETRLPLLGRGNLEQLASVPIAAFNGYNGTGKSMAMVACAMQHLDAGRPVLSTVRLQDYRAARDGLGMPECLDRACASSRHGQPGHYAAHPLWVPFTDWRQLLDFRDGYVAIDEATGVADAREHQGMPVQVGNYLPQLRRRDVLLGWSTIDWRFADARLRRLTFALLWAVGLAPVYMPGEMWGRNRAFYWRVYDARGIGDDFDPSTKREGVQVLARLGFRRGPSLVQHAYDSMEDVLTLGSLDSTGMCMDCGGHRARPRCNCKADGAADEPKPRRDRTRAPARTAKPEDGVRPEPARRRRPAQPATAA